MRRDSYPAKIKNYRSTSIKQGNSLATLNFMASIKPRCPWKIRLESDKHRRLCQWGTH